MNLGNFISAILLNNPTDVSNKLEARGILQEYAMEYDLYDVIVDAIAGMTDQEAKAFLTDVLSVPVDPYGEGAEMLTAAANRTTITYLLEKESSSPGLQATRFLQQLNVNWISILFVLFCLLIIALIFRLLQRK